MVDVGDILLIRPQDQHVSPAPVLDGHAACPVGLADPGGEVLLTGAPVVGGLIPLGQPAVGVRPGEEHRQNTDREHPEQQQGGQSVDMMLDRFSSHGSFTSTVISGIRLSANTL